jgi:hypothetical protein
MAASSAPRDAALDLLLALLTEPEQQALLAYIGRNGLQHDDDMFVLLAMLKIGAVLVLKVADTVDGQQHAAGDMREMLDAHCSALARLLAHEREALLDRWGDMMGVEQTITATIEGHKVALAAQADTIKRLMKGLDQRTEVLRPLLDLVRASPGSSFSPTTLVLDNIAQATRDGIEAGLTAQLGARWCRWLTYGRDMAWTLGIVILLYRTWV